MKEIYQRNDEEYEDKQLICDLLCTALQHTDQYADLLELKYRRSDQNEYVDACFKNGYKTHVTVTIDSGAAMIRDIVAALR